MRKQPFFYFLLVAPILITVMLFACNNETTTHDTEGKTDGTLTARATLPPRPRMWLDMNTSISRVAFYARFRNELTNLINTNGVEETRYLSYDSLAFAKMIDHFRNLHFVWLDIIIVVKNNKLTLIYQPTSAAGKLDYYTLPDNATDFDPNDSRYHLRATDVENMIKAYKKIPLIGNSRMRILRKELDATDPVNYAKEDLRNPLLNTLSIRYDSISIEEMIKEIHYQSTVNGNRVSGIRAMFAMIGPDGLEHEPDSGKYKNRLLLHFEFMKRNSNGEHEVFYLDTTHNAVNRNIDFSQRRQQAPLDYEKYGWRYKGLDKGQLCPAHCPEVGDGK